MRTSRDKRHRRARATTGKHCSDHRHRSQRQMKEAASPFEDSDAYDRMSILTARAFSSYDCNMTIKISPGDEATIPMKTARDRHRWRARATTMSAVARTQAATAALTRTDREGNRSVRETREHSRALAVLASSSVATYRCRRPTRDGALACRRRHGRRLARCRRRSRRCRGVAIGAA